MTKRAPNPIADGITIQWHPTKNGEKTPSDYTAGSKFKAWWKCDRKHDFPAAIQDMVRGSGCVYCAGNKPWPGETDLATLRPEMAKQWHPTKNTLNPTEVTVASKSKVWWIGACGHDFIASVGARTVSGTGCPYCAGQKILVGFNDLATTHPEVAAHWHPTLNGDVTTQQTTAGVNKKFWWLGSCGHEFNGSVAEKIRSENNGCPYCAGKKILIGFNDLASQFPDIAAEWSPENKISADAVSAKSLTKFKWACSQGHTFTMAVRSRTHFGVNCIYCSQSRILAGYNDLATTHPHLAKEWDYTLNKDLVPSMFSKTNQDKIWWKCENGNEHSYNAPIASRISVNSTGCNICGNYTFVSGMNDIATTHPKAAKEWHPSKNGDLTPSDVGKSFRNKVWWLCAKGHDWEVSPLARIRGSSKITNCPTCQSKTFSSAGEKEVAGIFKALGEEVITNRKNILQGSELDIYLPQRKVAIEYNGIYWHSMGMNGKTENYHYDKWLACKNIGIQLIQIWEDDWNNRKEITLKTVLQEIGIFEEATAKLPKLGLVKEGEIHVEETSLEILSTDVAKDFFGKHHIQGFCMGTQYVGISNKNGDIIMALIVEEQGKSLNILRYATDRKVEGGFYKLLKHLEKRNPSKQIFAFSDHCMSTGELYKNHGFAIDEEHEADYMYVVRNNRKHKSDYGVSSFKESPSRKWEDGLSEIELAKLNGIARIYDAGKTRWASK